MVEIEMAAAYASSILQDLHAQILRDERHVEFLNSAIEGLHMKESLLAPKLQMNPRNSRLLTESRSIQTALRIQMKNRDDMLASIQGLRLEIEKIETRERMLAEMQQPPKSVKGPWQTVINANKARKAARAASGAEPGAANKTGGKRSNRRTRERRSQRSNQSKRRYRR